MCFNWWVSWVDLLLEYKVYSVEEVEPVTPSLSIDPSKLPVTVALPARVLKKCHSISAKVYSRHGTCLRSIRDCTFHNMACDITCSGANGWHGEACSIDHAASIAKQVLLTTLMDAMTDASKTRDASNPQVLEQQALSISALSKSVIIMNGETQNR